MRNLFLKIFSLFCAVALVASCGGRTANPTKTAYFQDPLKNCAQLEDEMATLEHDIIALEPHTKKNNQNNAMMLSSLLLVFPLALTDPNSAEYIEYQALRRRYNHLLTVSTRKGCKPDRLPLTVDRRFAEDE